jgi:outer membrane receptor protein involved in Fe transport
MMGDQLTLAASVFYNDWSNQQVEVWATPGDSSSSYIVNAGNSTSYGAELELSYAAGANLDVFASIGLLESEFEDFTVGENDYSGQAFPLTARQNAAVGYRYNAGDGWFSSGTMTFTGARTGSLGSGVSGFGLDSYTVVDLEVGYQWRSGATVVAYANNLFDTTYFLNESGPGSSASLGDRREVGVQLTYSF